jgi:acetyltransferase-like isoleucine patch superfamily enzyme
MLIKRLSRSRTQSPERPWDPEFEALQDYLRTGRLNMTLISRGLISLFIDPWFTFLASATGPLGFFLRGLYYKRRLKHLGQGALIDVGVYFYGHDNISIGDFTWVDSEVKLIAPYGGIRVGKRVHLANNAFLSGAGGIEIEDYVGIAPRAMILSSTEYPVPGKRMSGPMLPIEQRGLRQGRVVIKKDAFVSANSIIMPGVVVGEGAVVGANSIVNKDVPPYEIVFGSPAKKIGERAPVDCPDI